MQQNTFSPQVVALQFLVLLLELLSFTCESSILFAGQMYVVLQQFDFRPFLCLQLFDGGIFLCQR